MKKTREFIVLGSGGHAGVIVDLLESCKYKIAGIIVKNYDHNLFLGYPILGDDKYLKSLASNKYYFAIGVGTANNSLETRQKIFLNLKRLNFLVPSIVHKSAIVSPRAKLFEGSQILMGAKIGANATIGENTIINTNSNIEHEVKIGGHCHIAPSSTICGKTVLGKKVFLGAGTTVLNDIKIVDNCLIGAGSLVIKNILVAGKYFGNPVNKK